MKRCPECRRDYYDDSLLYCLDDGSALLDGPASGSGEEPATAILSKPGAAGGGFRSDDAMTEFLSSFESQTDNSRSVAVLPFVNMSTDEENEYFCDGLAEELLNALTKIEDLQVAARTSAFSFKGKNANVREIGEKLGVKTVLEGSVRKSGNKLRISVQLVKAKDGFHLWSERYDREMQDIFDVQDEIALAVIDALKLKIFGYEKEALLKRYTVNAEAYELYLRGRYHLAKRLKDDILRGIDDFQQAIKLDPNFALAYVGIAESYNSMPTYLYMSPKEAGPQATAASARALQIDPVLAEAHAARAVSVAMFDWDWGQADREFRRSLELSQNAASIHFHYALSYLLPMGRTDEAITEIRRAIELEPLDLNMSGNLAGAYMYARENGLALEQARKTYDLEPNFVGGRAWLGFIYNASGMYDEAIALHERSLQSDPTSQISLYLAGYGYARSGRRHDAEEIIKKWRAIGQAQYVPHYSIATILAALGEMDEAFAELEKAFEARDLYLTRLKIDPFIDPLRDDPRFKDLLRRMNLPD